MASANPKTKPVLKVHHNPKPEGLLKIKAMFGEAKHMPEYVYQNLSEQQRTVLCFAAGLKRIDLGKNWNEFTADQRHALRDSLMLITNLVESFSKANALDPYKWLQGAQPNEPKYNDGNVVAPISKLQQVN